MQLGTSSAWEASSILVQLKPLRLVLVVLRRKRTYSLTSLDWTHTFPDLPGSTQEVVESAGIIRGSKQLLLDRDATEAAFKALPLSDFRILHLAVHGVANTRASLDAQPKGEPRSE